MSSPESLHISLAAEQIFTILGLPVTNSILMTWLAGLVLIIGGALASRQIRLIPGRWQNAIELVIESLLGLVDSILGDRRLTVRAFPLIATLFLLIVLSNWLGLIPGVGTVGLKTISHGESVLTPIFRPTNADINSTLAWAMVAVIGSQVIAISTLGIVNQASKFINIKGLLSFSFAGAIDFFVGLLELISELSKMISLSFRLFGNIFAGEVLLTVIAFLVPYIAPLPFYGLELFVGLIQGVVFATLTLVFIKIAATDHHHESEPHSDEISNNVIFINEKGVTV